ncbi:DUF397 domain-containing protein [Streptomyces sp. NPDC001941]|uniref:DUF397 domain-containing protein n=1 Tax=Streptomyces sp. NPDC001941 TaxID=3154659 RepID=UPI00331E5E12
MAPKQSWFKSTYSSDQGGSCIGVADLGTQVGVRDTKDDFETGVAFLVAVGSWKAFIEFVTEV